jgi:hypothetical protein
MHFAVYTTAQTVMIDPLSFVSGDLSQERVTFIDWQGW